MIGIVGRIVQDEAVDNNDCNKVVVRDLNEISVIRSDDISDSDRDR